MPKWRCASWTAKDVMDGMEAGGNDFIAKPFQQEKLMARVQYWMSHRVPLG
jgi:DNA-binding response OmpR family regulator